MQCAGSTALCEAAGAALGAQGGEEEISRQLFELPGRFTRHTELEELVSEQLCELPGRLFRA